MVFYSKSKKETQKIATDLATKTKSGPLSLKLQRASIIALEGELGAGKTTFIQAFAKALGIKSKVKSPTFNIIKKYKIPNVPHSALYVPRSVYHIDCYRLKDYKEAIPLGIKDIFKEDNAVILIEWPERISEILPKNIIRVHIDHIDKNKRKISIKR
ncbi:MAG: tRNA (adenosine(37)-N6)-threonylcarbamoyltransferase complex ATPase subunit type 1 TsaE [Candidatus Nealsonbacteria bacterium]